MTKKSADQKSMMQNYPVRNDFEGEVYTLKDLCLLTC